MCVCPVQVCVLVLVRDDVCVCALCLCVPLCVVRPVFGEADC